MKSPEERFWAKVRKGPSCWLWTGASAGSGYGLISAGKRGLNPIYVHRLSWELAHGPIQNGLFVCHHCDNRKCVRPEHLFLGTAKQNWDDMFRKGRGRPPILSGEQGPGAKLSERDVRTIRREAAAGVDHTSLARRFGVTISNIGSIVARKTWRCVS